MATIKRRFTLLEPPRSGWWPRVRRWWAGLRSRRHLEALPEPIPLEELAANIDFSLKQRAAVHAVRRFIELIDTYQLHTRKQVHVVSHYVVPDTPGLQNQVPEWLAHRVRFGVVDPKTKETTYVGIRAVDVVWAEDGTELYLHLTDKIDPGTRAFVAAWLGEGDGRTGLQDTPGVLIGP